MPLVLADRVKENSSTTGTGTFTLTGAQLGFQSFAVVGNANTTYYTIQNPGTSEWEVGIGTYTSANTTIARTTVLSSSNSNSVVSFSAGTKDVFVTYPAQYAVTTIDTATLTNKTIVPRVSSTTSIASPLAWNSSNFDLYAATAQAGALTINADAGTPSNGQKIIFRFKDNGTARALTFTAGVSNGFRAVGVYIPVSGGNLVYTTTINKTVYFGCIYNTADSRWDIVALSQE